MAKLENGPQNTTPDGLLGASPEHAVQLSEDSLDAVVGGNALSKVKTADKQAAAVNAFIRG